MNKRRLLKLADLLEADAKNRRGIRFNLYTVVTTDSLSTKDKPVELKCGTQACAMGLAALSGAFKRQGLSYKVLKAGIIDTAINGRVRRYDLAAVAVFDISMREADFLFTPSQYSDYAKEASLRGAGAERYVAQRIRDFVAGKVAP